MMFPYMLLACLAAVLIAMANARGHFFIPALGAALLNVVMIASVLGPTPQRVYEQYSAPCGTLTLPSMWYTNFATYNAWFHGTRKGTINWREIGGCFAPLTGFKVMASSSYNTTTYIFLGAAPQIGETVVVDGTTHTAIGHFAACATTSLSGAYGFNGILLVEDGTF